MVRLIQRRRRADRTAFTLIELLVVIAIIAILAAILFPVFARTKEKAREAMCMSNMKQVALSVQRYLDEWNGCFPDQASVSIPYTNADGGSWIQNFSHRYRKLIPGGNYAPAGIGLVLRPYIKNLDVFKCPSEWRKLPKNLGRPWSLSYEEGSSYYLKFAMSYFAYKVSRPLKLSDIMFPLRAVMLYEEAWHNSLEMPLLWNSEYWFTVPDSQQPPFIRTNAIYFDCHVGKYAVYWNTSGTYDANWYFWRANDTRIGNWDGVKDGINGGWDLRLGCHDMQ